MRRGIVWLLVLLCCLAVAALAADHILIVSAGADPVTVPWHGSTQLTASASDSLGYPVVQWAWSDNEAGGKFDNALAQNPIYTPPKIHGRGWRYVDGTAATLTVTATSAAEDGLRASTSFNVYSMGRLYDAGGG